jgi:hypothetical protein
LFFFFRAALVFLDIFAAGLDFFAAVLRLTGMSSSYVGLMMIPLHPMLKSGETQPPVTGLANDGLLRSNVDRVGIQPSLPTTLIGHFYELAFP